MTPDEIYSKHVREEFPRPTLQQVEEFETRIGNKLPKSFRQFVQNFNGGYFLQLGIPGSEPNAPRIDELDFLSGFNATSQMAELGYEGMVDIYEDNEEGNISILPIGYTAAGCMVILLIAGEGKGEVYGKLPYEDEYYLIASTFDGFLGKLITREQPV